MVSFENIRAIQPETNELEKISLSGWEKNGSRMKALKLREIAAIVAFIGVVALLIGGGHYLLANPGSLPTLMQGGLGVGGLALATGGGIMWMLYREKSLQKEETSSTVIEKA